MANGLTMDYGDMHDNCNLLKETAQNILYEKSEMISKVNALCESWDSAASPVYQEDFATVATQIEKIEVMVTNLTNSIEKYIEDMQALDHSYAQR